MIIPPNQSAAANRRPAGQSDGSGNLAAPLAADREKSPIVGASVNLKSFWHIGPKKYEASTVTEANGQFLIKPEQKWSIYIVPSDPAPLKTVVSITSNGYPDVKKEIRAGTMGPSKTNLGIIEMQRQK
jgi:hypothetical protein